MENKISADVIFVYDEDKFLERVLTDDIYFIETIKSTHYCTVYHKKGQGILRADIIHLQEVLKDGFFKSRSSTLVHLKYITKIDRKNRIIYFENSNTLKCSYTAQSYAELKKRLHIRCYRK